MDTVLQLVALLFCCLSGGLGPQVSLGQEFRDSPANTVALTNHPITLGCSAPDPSPPPEIDWYHNGFLASSNVGASISYDAGSGRSEYAIGNVGYLDAGVYQCVAVDVLGVALFQSGGGNLTVQGYPAFVQSLSAVTSPIGGEAVFRCEVLSNPPANVSWSFHTSGGPFLPLGNGGRVLISETVLTISNVQASDEGFYECTAENSYGANSTLGRLSIEDLPITLSLTLTPTLSPLVLTAGEELVLRCSPAPGSEVTSLVWQRGAETLSIGVSQDNSGILFTIASVQPADNGTYNCLATDSDGNTESASISVEVYTLPMASVTPSLVSTVANQTLNATLTPRCQATGYPVPEISWLRPNGEPQPSIAGVPQFGALGRNDNGVFQCVATNAVGIGTAQVTFVVEDSPLILSPPVDTEAGAGQLVTFSCLAIGPPEPTISWRRLDSALQSDSVQLEGTLYLFSVTANDNGRYECNATNIYGWRVAAANLTVLPDRPQVVSISSSVATLIGQTFTLNCSVSGPPSTRLDWYHNGSLVSSDSDPRATISLSGSLTIADATASHSGVYACNASTSFAFDAALVDVTVGAVPVILGPPSPSDLPPGSSIFLECRLGGLPHPSTTWYHTSELGVRQSLPAVAERITTHTEGLQLVSLTREDTGVYECLAENALGQASASARLRVEGYPQVTSITPSVLVAGETYLLTCNTLYNYPTATIAWERVDGAPLPEQRLSVNEQGQLVISPAAVEDEGDIRCSATNQYGRSNTTVFVTVYVRPSVLVSPSPFTAILDSSASLSCIVDGRPSPTLVWTLPPSSGGPSSIPPNDLTPIPHRYTFTGSLSISGIAASDAGTYTCTGSNLVGNTSSALQLEVKGAAPVSAQVTALGSTLLALSWEPPPPQLTGQLVSYQVEYGVSGSLERQIRSSSGTETRQLVLPNLEEGTSYEFAVRGVYQGGIAGVDFTVLGSTLETAPTGPPRNLTLTPLEEAIRVSWLPPLLEDQNGRLTFYHVHYRESPRTVDNSFNFLTVSVLPTNATTNVSSGQLEEFDLPNLVGGRSYDIKIQAATAVGNGPNSTVLTATALIPFPLTLVLAITIPVGSVLLLLLLLLLSCLCVWGWQRHSRRGKHSPLVEDEAFERQLNKKGRVQKNAISGPIPGIAPTIDTSVSSKFTGRGKAGRVLHLKPKIITAADVAMPPSPGETVQKVSQRDIFPSRGFSQEAQRDETEFQASPDEEGSAEHIAPYASVQYGAARMGGWKAADIWDQPIHEEEEGEEEEGEREALEEMDDMGISESSNGDPGDELSASRNALDLSLENVSIQPQMAPTLDPHHTDPSPESSRDDVNLVYSTVPQGYLQKKRARRLKEQQAQEAKARRSHQRMQERIRKEQRKRDERERKAMEKEARRHAKDETTRKELGLENVVRLHEVDLSSRQGRAQAQFIDAATAAIF